MMPIYYAFHNVTYEIYYACMEISIWCPNMTMYVGFLFSLFMCHNTPSRWKRTYVSMEDQKRKRKWMLVSRQLISSKIHYEIIVFACNHHWVVHMKNGKKKKMVWHKPRCGRSSTCEK